MYVAEGSIGQAWDSLARRSGCTLPAFKKAISALQDDGKVTVTSEGIWSEKCEKHITQRRERQTSAKAAADARWEKSKQKQRKADANALKAHCQPEPEPEPEPYKEDTNVSLSRSVIESHFKDFWDAFPHKGGHKTDRKNALAAFSKALKNGATVEDIALGVKNMPKHKDYGTRFQKGPTPWLNGESWADEYPDQPQLKAINGDRHEPSRKTDRLQRIVTTAAAGTSGQGWG